MAVKAFTLPDVGEGVAEGELVTWLVEPGERVTEDQPVAEVETDKSLVEIPSPYNGTVKELLVDEGTIVPVGDEIISFDVDEDAVETDAEAESEAEPDRERDTTAAVEADEEVTTSEGRVFAPPRVRRLARELGVDIATVDGSGQAGRINEQDVREAAESGDEDETEGETSGPKPFTPSGKSAVSKGGESVSGAGLASDGETASTAASESPQPTPEAATRDRTAAAPATRKLADELGIDINAVPTDVEREGQPFVSPTDVRSYAEAQQDAHAADAAAVSEAAAEPAVDGAETRIPYRGIRRTIGEQMVRSKETIPHVSHHDTATVSDLVDLRTELKPVAAESGARLTYLPFVMKAVVRALKQMPVLNSTLDETNEEVVLRDDYHIGVAVATDARLLVPVVRNVDQKTILELSEEVVDLAERARERKLSREEMQGGTFTITNYGAIGGEYATPIINHPETAILGLGAIEKRPVVEEHEDGDEVVARETLPLSLSIDHRVIDGAEGAEFTNRVIDYLEQPNRLLLEST